MKSQIAMVLVHLKTGSAMAIVTTKRMLTTEHPSISHAKLSNLIKATASDHQPRLHAGLARS